MWLLFTEYEILRASSFCGCWYQVSHVFLTGSQLILPPSSQSVHSFQSFALVLVCRARPSLYRRQAQFTALVPVYRPHPSVSCFYETAILHLDCYPLELELVQRKSSFGIIKWEHFWLFGTLIQLYLLDVLSDLHTESLLRNYTNIRFPFHRD